MSNAFVIMIVLCSCVVPQVSAEVNLALNKNASMSSIEEPYTADRAVDGNTAQTLASGSCSSTQVNAFDVEAWWRVDLGGVHSITRVNIYYKNTDLHRFSGFQVFITNTPDITSSAPCYKDNNGVQGAPFPASFISLAGCNGQGRYVTIYKTRAAANTCMPGASNVNFCSILELCEVQVYGCEEGKYGTSCSLNCSANCASGTCDATSGNCIGGCIDGYTGSKCDARCEEGKYGTSCSLSCSANCASGTCDATSGNCIGGCIDGYTGSKCDAQCDQGFYGTNCEEQCSNCLNGDCDHVQGKCTSGCKTGWQGTHCTTECPDGSYGDDCREKCGHCLKNTKCNHVNGSCPRGCADGWKGNFCDRACEDGKYGPRCSLTCSCGYNFLCNHVDGKCTPKRCEARHSLPFVMELYMRNHIPSIVDPGYRQSSRDDLERCKLLCLALNFCKLIAVKHTEKGRDCKIFDDATLNQPIRSSTDYDIYWKLEY